MAPFDFVFIDADKSNNDNYLAWALRLSRPGPGSWWTMSSGTAAIADANSVDPDVTGTRQMFEMMAREPRLAATAIQTVGDKGWDGFALAIVE